MNLLSQTRSAIPITLLLLLTLAPLTAQEYLAELLEQPGAQLSDADARAAVVDEARQAARSRRDRAARWAADRALPMRRELPNGSVQEAIDLVDGQLVYLTTYNADAMISTGADVIHEDLLTVGDSVRIGMWDGGAALADHQEFGGRLENRDGSVSIDHATHVAGTLVAAGVVANARGMAPEALMESYDWNDDTAEMAERAATAPGQSEKLYLSNHSYGFVAGWNRIDNGSYLWEWHGDGTDASAFDADFGRYDVYARDQDALAYNAPYYLIFRGAGNERVENPAANEQVSLSPGGDSVVAYDPELHPSGDGLYRGGFETISHSALAKNVLTIGSVSDAVSNGQRDAGIARISSFSSWGPTDDGRIKPDIVANGEGVYSTRHSSNTAYGTFSGTSMATPNAAGSAALIVDLYGKLFPGEAMRSSTLKGLLIHTADDLGDRGPDYRHGWGLMNVRAAAELLADHVATSEKQRLTEDALSTGVTQQSRSFVWDGVSPIRATLCWTDPPGSSTRTSNLRSPRLVNDLDLEVVGPDGSTFLPYVMPFVGDWSPASMEEPATIGRNSTDNIEQVYLPVPPLSGVYKVVVSFQGTLSGDLQHYSLMLSGSTAEEPPPPPLEITGVSPSKTLPSVATIDIYGTGFLDETQAKLVRAGEPEVLASRGALLGDVLRCTFDLSGAASGLWDLVVDNPDGETFTLEAAFTLSGAIWSETFDSAESPSGWSSESTTGSNAWTLSDARSHSPPVANFAPVPSSKTTTDLVSPAIAIPEGSTGLQFKFWHAYDLEDGQDGGRLEFSIDGEPWFDVEASHSGAIFASNGYNTTIRAIGRPTDRSELAGSSAWSGTSNGFVETIVNLVDSAKYAGHSLRVRWRLASNAGTSSPGWHVDTISLLGEGDIGNSPPTIIQTADTASTEVQADADGTSFDVVRGATVDLSIVADDDGGESSLSYQWTASISSGASVYFSPNGMNAASQTTATFEALGDYRLSVAVSDPEGLTVTSTVAVRVVEELSGLSISPELTSMRVGESKTFSAMLLNQFDAAMASQPASFMWSVNGGGFIDDEGRFSATTAGGPFVISASSGNLNGTAAMTVSPKSATVSLSKLEQTYDGQAKTVEVATEPSGLSMTVTYDGSPQAPKDAGSYAVIASINDPNHVGSATGTLVIHPATATVLLGHLDQPYDGQPKVVEVATEPSGLPVTVTYDGSPEAPVDAGSYAVLASISDSNHVGSATGTLVVSRSDFEHWQQQYFTESERATGLADPEEDPDRDGANNLTEFALGGHPRVPEPLASRVLIMEEASGDERLALVFTRPIGLSGVQYIVETAQQSMPGPDHQISWEILTETEIHPVPSSPMETVIAMCEHPITRESRCLMRLRIQLSDSGE